MHFHLLDFSCISSISSFFVTSCSTSPLFLFFFVLLLVKGLPREEVVYLELGGEASREISKQDPTWATKSSCWECVFWERSREKVRSPRQIYYLSPTTPRDDGSLFAFTSMQMKNNNFRFVRDSSCYYYIGISTRSPPYVKWNMIRMMRKSFFLFFPSSVSGKKRFSKRNDRFEGESNRRPYDRVIESTVPTGIHFGNISSERSL